MPVLPKGVINPGVKKLVEWLNEWGFETCDSGDGQTHDHECDRETAYVVISAEPDDLIALSHSLVSVLREHAEIEVSPVGRGPVYVQANYDPVNRMGFIDLTGVTDDDLP